MSLSASSLHTNSTTLASPFTLLSVQFKHIVILMCVTFSWQRSSDVGFYASIHKWAAIYCTFIQAQYIFAIIHAFAKIAVYVCVHKSLHIDTYVYVYVCIAMHMIYSCACSCAKSQPDSDKRLHRKLQIAIGMQFCIQR